MREFAYLLLNVTMVIVTTWILKKFLESFFEPKRQGFEVTGAWIIFAGYQLFIEYHKGVASIWTTVISVLLSFAIAVIGYEKTGRIKILYLVIFYAVWCLVEMMVYFCLNMAGNSEDGFAVLGSVISKIIMIILVYVFSSFWEKHRINAIPPLYYYTLMFVPLGSIFIAVNAFYIGRTECNFFTSMVTVCVLLFINIIIFEICSKISENFLLENERTVYDQQIDIISKSTQEQKKMMEEFYEEKHNLVNELVALMDGVEQSNQECVMENLRRIIKSYDMEERISNSGNNTIDALINFKYAAAKEQGILFKLKIFVPENLPISQCDLGVVIGNALDNAIEATKNCVEHEKVIRVSIGIKKEALIVIIKNPYEHMLRKDLSGNLLSTKKECKRHGYGVNAIKHVVERYQGEVLVEEENQEFVLTAIMNLGEI